MLTIGIPTYNRKDVIVEHVEWLINASAYDFVEILIIDNDSPDGTFKHLKEICENTPIRVLKNSTNIGFIGNFVRLFEECQTEYLLITSDEDPVILNNINSLITFLQKYNPLFVSTQFYLSNELTKRLYRGQENINQIRPYEFNETAFYISGLIYKVKECQQVLTDIKFHIEQPLDQVYPQVLLAAELIMRKNCFWWDMPITKQKYTQSTTYIKDNIYDKYYHLPARWNQHKSFVDYFEDRIKNINDPEMKKRATQMLKVQQRYLFHNLWHAIKIERPEMIHSLNMSVIEFYFKIPFMREFIRRPMPSSKKLIKKILNLIHKSKKK